MDRNNNTYWHFAGCPEMLFVQRPRISNEVGTSAAAATATGTSAAAGGVKANNGSVGASVASNSSNVVGTNESLEKLRAAITELTATSTAGTSSSSHQTHKLRQLIVNYFGKSLSPARLDILLADSTVTMLYQSRPEKTRFEWGAYCSNNALWAIWEALDDRGERERELKAAIKATFDLQEPPIVYLNSGSEFIGQKVRRKFGKKVQKTLLFNLDYG